MPDIGETLREARMRRRIDMAEVEAATKIRAKYLRALENEEWRLLPGPTFVKTFLRTYAEYLELDARSLVEEYKLRYERPGAGEATPFGGLAAGRAQPRRSRRGRPPAALGPIAVVVGIVVVLLAALYALGSFGGGDQSAQPAATPKPTRTPAATRTAPAKRRKPPPKRVKLRLVAT
jgi:cytoskeleton protein RodZ